MTIEGIDKVLIVVESINKAKTITGILKTVGFTNISVEASNGHIMLLEDGGPAFNSGIYPDNNFSMNLQIAKDKKIIVDTLKEKAANVDKVFLMTDCDREGELIAWSIIKFCDIPNDKCYRIITNELTQKAIISALNNPLPINYNLINAGLGRMMTDKLIGYGLSPIGKKYIGTKSIGRYQTIGLKIISDREADILNFIPELYFNVYINFEKNGKRFSAKYFMYDDVLTDKFTNIKDAEAVINNCIPNEYFISSIKHTIKNNNAKPPFCTSSFLQEAYNKLGLNAKDAMKYAQKLFEGIKINNEYTGLVTYFKTDSTEISLEYVNILKNFITKTYGHDMFMLPKQKDKLIEQSCSEALRVTNPSITPELLKKYVKNELLLQVYQLIWNRTIASCMQGTKFKEIEYTIINNGHKFKFSQKDIICLGHNSLKCPNISGGSPEVFKHDEKLSISHISLNKKFTQPKQRYTISTFIKALDDCGIGGSSTYISIMETLLSVSRGYAIINNNEIIPTERGLQLAKYCKRALPAIVNINYTKNIDKRLDSIANGDLELITYMECFYNNLKQLITNVRETGFEEDTETKFCPICKNKMVLRRSRFGKLFYGCSKYPMCKGILGL